jgi:hypothetical protein
MRKVFRNILISVTGVEYIGIEAWDEEQLINKLRDFINCKRYYLLLLFYIYNNLEIK